MANPNRTRTLHLQT